MAVILWQTWPSSGSRTPASRTAERGALEARWRRCPATRLGGGHRPARPGGVAPGAGRHPGARPGPVRHGRMLVSPFTFYRGAAKIMAADLAGTPTAGLDAQLCGDAHLSNFGAFASPERELLFGLNDFDETLPGPFEYDVKRLAASFTIAARNNGFAKADTKAVTRASVVAYREAMAGFAQMGRLEVWYAHLTEEELLQAMRRAAKAAKTKKQAKAAGGPSRRPRRWPPRPTPMTACRRCPSSASGSTAATGSSASPRSWSRCGSWRPPMASLPRRDGAGAPPAVPRLPGHPPG